MIRINCFSPGHHGGERWWRRSGQEGRVAGLWPGKSPWRSHADQARSRNSRNPGTWCRWLSSEHLGSACRGGSSGGCSCCGRGQGDPQHVLPRLTNGRCGRRGRSGGVFLTHIHISGPGRLRRPRQASEQQLTPRPAAPRSPGPAPQPPGRWRASGVARQPADHGR
jgi:hypothetical protein